MCCVLRAWPCTALSPLPPLSTHTDVILGGGGGVNQCSWLLALFNLGWQVTELHSTATNMSSNTRAQTHTLTPSHAFLHVSPHSLTHAHTRAPSHAVPHVCHNTLTQTNTHMCTQVATDTRLWLYSQLLDIRSSLQELISVATSRAEAEADVLMPGGGVIFRVMGLGFWAQMLGGTGQVGSGAFQVSGGTVKMSGFGCWVQVFRVGRCRASRGQVCALDVAA